MSAKVFVGNLSFRTRENDLAHEFEQVGKVLTANIITRGPRSLGYGFVEYETPELAQRAANVMNHKEIDGRPVNVEVAKPRDPNALPSPGVASGLPPPVRGFGGFRRGPPQMAFRPYPPVGMMPPRGPRREYMPPVVEYAPPGMGYARPQRRLPRPHTDSANRLAEPSKTTLFVANLPFVVEEDTLREIFAEFNVKEARVVKRQNGRSKGYGFVELGSEEDQRRALQTLDKIEIEGREIIIKPALSSQAGAMNEQVPAVALAPAGVAVPAPAEQKVEAAKDEKKDEAAPKPAEKQAPK